MCCESYGLWICVRVIFYMISASSVRELIIIWVIVGVINVERRWKFSTLQLTFSIILAL